MSHHVPAHGLWGIAFVNAAQFIGRFVLLASSWRVLNSAQRKGRLAMSGPYARLRHPQYLAFILVMIGFLVQWPTLATLVMFPVLVFMYRRLSPSDEREAATRFGGAWVAYAAATPRWTPCLATRRAWTP